MKFFPIRTFVLFAAICMAGCHYGPTALSAEGKKLAVDQTVYVAHASFACMSADELHQAITLKAAGEGSQLYQYFKDGHCGIFQENEKVKVVRIESADGYQAVVVTDLDDKSAPPLLWVKNDQLSVRD